MRVCLPGTKHEFSSPHGSGAHRVMYELYRNLLQEKKPNQIIEKVEFNTLPFFAEGFSPYIHSIFYDFSKYDIVHNLAARPLCMLRRGNAITLSTVHDIRVLVAPEARAEDKASLKRILGAYFVLQKGARFELASDFICASSTQTRDEAISLGYDRKRIFVVSLGVDKRFIDTPVKRKKNKIFKIGYIGTLASTKNVEFAIKAFNKLDRSDAVFEIWGKPLASDYYKHLIDLSKSNKNIGFMGFVPEEKLVGTYDSFDVLVHPILYTGFELEILEAQARGVPVIVCKRGKISAEVKKYCFEADDEAHVAQIIQDLKNNGYNEKRRKDAMGYARSFTWEKTARDTLEVYKNIINAKGKI